MKNIYEERLLQHYKNPHHARLLTDKPAQKMVNASCGDEIEIQLEIKDDKIVNIGYNIHGCVITTASASLLSDFLIGKTVEEVSKLTTEDMKKLIGIEVSPVRLKCLLLPLEAVQKSL